MCKPTLYDNDRSTKINFECRHCNIRNPTELILFPVYTLYDKQHNEWTEIPEKKFFVCIIWYQYCKSIIDIHVYSKYIDLHLVGHVLWPVLLMKRLKKDKVVKELDKTMLEVS